MIITGIGKSGHVAQKIAATFASTGTPAFFVHPSEASHGDLGMITRDDAIVALSWSGESVELGNILTYSRRFKVPLIAITSRTDSALAKQSDVVLELPRVKEACPHGLAPTTSTTMQLALGDCLAVALLEHKGFTAHDFKVFHPGGSLGAALKFVADVMHTGEQLPLVGEDTPMSAALVTMTQKSFGCLGVTDGKGRLAGVITDGDLQASHGRGPAHGPHCRHHDEEAQGRVAGHAGIGRAGGAQRVAHHGIVRGRQGQARRHPARPRSAARRRGLRSSDWIEPEVHPARHPGPRARDPSISLLRRLWMAGSRQQVPG